MKRARGDRGAKVKRDRCAALYENSPLCPTRLEADVRHARHQRRRETFVQRGGALPREGVAQTVEDAAVVGPRHLAELQPRARQVQRVRD